MRACQSAIGLAKLAAPLTADRCECGVPGAFIQAHPERTRPAWRKWRAGLSEARAVLPLLKLD